MLATRFTLTRPRKGKCHHWKCLLPLVAQDECAAVSMGSTTSQRATGSWRAELPFHFYAGTETRGPICVLYNPRNASRLCIWDVWTIPRTCVLASRGRKRENPQEIHRTTPQARIIVKAPQGKILESAAALPSLVHLAARAYEHRVRLRLLPGRALLSFTHLMRLGAFRRFSNRQSCPAEGVGWWQRQCSRFREQRDPVLVFCCIFR